jgi:hypothetical protein
MAAPANKGPAYAIPEQPLCSYIETGVPEANCPAED